jgi:hypothetical protein
MEQHTRLMDATISAAGRQRPAHRSPTARRRGWRRSRGYGCPCRRREPARTGRVRANFSGCEMPQAASSTTAPGAANSIAEAYSCPRLHQTAGSGKTSDCRLGSSSDAAKRARLRLGTRSRAAHEAGLGHGAPGPHRQARGGAATSADRDPAARGAVRRSRPAAWPRASGPRKSWPAERTWSTASEDSCGRPAWASQMAAHGVCVGPSRAWGAAPPAHRPDDAPGGFPAGASRRWRSPGAPGRRGGRSRSGNPADRRGPRRRSPPPSRTACSRRWRTPSGSRPGPRARMAAGRSPGWPKGWQTKGRRSKIKRAVDARDEPLVRGVGPEEDVVALARRLEKAAPAHAHDLATAPRSGSSTCSSTCRQCTKSKLLSSKGSDSGTGLHGAGVDAARPRPPRCTPSSEVRLHDDVGARQRLRASRPDRGTRSWGWMLKSSGTFLSARRHQDAEGVRQRDRARPVAHRQVDQTVPGHARLRGNGWSGRERWRGRYCPTSPLRMA